MACSKVSCADSEKALTMMQMAKMIRLIITCSFIPQI